MFVKHFIGNTTGVEQMIGAEILSQRKIWMFCFRCGQFLDTQVPSLERHFCAFWVFIPGGIMYLQITDPLFFRTSNHCSPLKLTPIKSVNSVPTESGQMQWKPRCQILVPLTDSNWPTRTPEPSFFVRWVGNECLSYSEVNFELQLCNPGTLKDISNNPFLFSALHISGPGGWKLLVQIFWDKVPIINSFFPLRLIQSQQDIN